MLKKILEDELKLEIQDIQSVSGGDINRAYKLVSSVKELFLKTNQRSRGDEMLKTEFHALEHLYALDTSFAPEPFHYFKFQEAPCLIMEYISSHAERMQNAHQSNLAEVLAKLHSQKAAFFGWKEDNFIGALPQFNNTEEEDLSWPTFYWKFRILPQLKMAVENDYFDRDIFRIENSLIRMVASFYSETQTPTLTHGDLWSGNYLIDESGNARLIDPAICYSHPDMDLSMSLLFGGFSNLFYEVYQQNSKENELASLNGHEDMFQLYYLLVHLNLFGSGYLERCRSIMDRYGLF